MKTEDLNELVEKYNNIKKEIEDFKIHLAEKLKCMECPEEKDLPYYLRDELHQKKIELNNVQISIIANEPEEEFVNRVNKVIKETRDSIPKVESYLRLAQTYAIKIEASDIALNEQESISKAYNKAFWAGLTAFYASERLLHIRDDEVLDPIEVLFYAFEQTAVSESTYNEASMLLCQTRFQRSQRKDKAKICDGYHRMFEKYDDALNDAISKINVLKRGIKERIKTMIKD